MEAADPAVVDSLDLWEAKTPEAESGKEKEEESSPELDELKKQDELARRLRPRGVIMAAELDDEDWLAYGEPSPLPALISTSTTYLAKKNVRVAARLEKEKQLRLSGLLWPEARKRWSGSVYAAHERRGNGQVIVFAGQPNYRAYFHGGERLLLNALLLGPGFGSNRPIDF
jgi:hypothetical protein